MKKLILITLILYLIVMPLTANAGNNNIKKNMRFVSNHLSVYSTDEAGRTRGVYIDCKLDMKVMTFVYYDGEKSIIVVYNGVVVAAHDTRSGDFVVVSRGRWIGRLQSVVSRQLESC